MSCLEVLGEAAASKKNQSNRGLGKAGLTGPRILYLQDALCFIFYFFENSQDLWVQIQAQPLISYMTLGKLLNLSVSHFLCL